MGLIQGTEIENSLLDRVKALEQLVAELQRKDVEATVLSDLSPDLGVIVAGEFRAVASDATSAEPGEGFTGVRISGDPMTYGSETVHIAGVNNDVLEAGISATTGKIIGAGGALTIGKDSILAAGIKYFQRFTGTNGSYVRTLELGTKLPSGSSIPAGYLKYYDSSFSSLQINGNFELGEFTDWDTATNGTWAISSTSVRGLYSAKLTTTGALGGSNLQTNGNMEAGSLSSWTASNFAISTTQAHGGTYSAKATTVASGTATLATNLGSPPRMAVTAGLRYTLDGWAYFVNDGATYTTRTIAVKWYTATSGGSLISTDTTTLNVTLDGWRETQTVFTAPATAAGAEIVVTLTRSGSGGTCVVYIDDVSLAASSYGKLTTNLGATPRMAVTAGNYYLLSIDTQQDVSHTWNTGGGIKVNWYTATSGGSLISTSTLTPSPGLNTFVTETVVLTAPATAAGAEIVTDFVRGQSTDTNTTINLYLDDIIFQQVTLVRELDFRDDGSYLSDQTGDLGRTLEKIVTEAEIRTIYNNTLAGDGSWDIQNTDLISGSQNFAYYDKLEIHLFGIRSTAAVTSDIIYLLFGTGAGTLDTTATNYATEQLAGVNATASAARNDDPRIALVAGASSTADLWSDLMITVYRAGSALHKNSICINGTRRDATNHDALVIHHNWENTGTISRIGIRTDNHSTDLIASGGRMVILGYKF